MLWWRGEQEVDNAVDNPRYKSRKCALRKASRPWLLARQHRLRLGRPAITQVLRRAHRQICTHLVTVL
ncbi:MAG: hypothetical protein CMN27_05075 [Salinisphaera sp.]|nr:hypothetical protein [Salinisphaera sp.]